MLVIKLREAMKAYQRRTGQKVTYKLLSEWTGLSQHAFEYIGRVESYGASLQTIEKICLTLDVSISDLLEILPDPPRKPKRKKKTAKKTSRKRAAKKR